MLLPQQKRKNLQKGKQITRIANTIRQIEEQDNQPPRPRQDPESPVRR
jgi:hypothetical protein